MDDNLAKGKIKARADNRARVLCAIFKEFDIKVSPKCLPLEAKEELVVAGQFLSKEGYCCSADLEVVIESLHKVNVRGIRQMQHIVGVIEQLHTAVAYTPDNLTKYVDLIAPMTESIKQGKWSEEAKAALLEMPALLKGLPRAYCHPDALVEPHTCLIMTGDVSDTGAGAALWKVQIPDARMVNVPEDLYDPALTQLVSVTASVLSSQDQKCLTFENEAKVLVKALKAKEGLLVNAMQGYTSNEKDENYKCKMMAFSDSTYATGAVSKLNLPTGEIPFATAKARKLMKWSRDIAFTKVLPIQFAHIPGDSNHLADYLSHISDAIVVMARNDRQSKAAEKYQAGLVTALEDEQQEDLGTAHNLRINMAITRHSYHDTPRTPENVEATEPFPEPVGWETVYMSLQEDQWQEICAAYQKDETPVYKIPTNSLYKVLTGLGEQPESQLEKERVQAWKHKIFAISVCEDGTPALFTQQSYLRIDQDNEEEPEVPDKLVMIVPKGAQVAMSTAEPVFEVGEEPSFTDTDLRTDILLQAHEFSMHARWEEMYSYIKRFSYWFTLVADIKTHIQQCALCIAKTKAARHAGFGLVSSCCYRHVGIDHKQLPPWLQAATGCCSILTMYDRAHSEIEMWPVETETATESALTVLVHWIKVRGLMRTMTTDQAAGFTSEMLDVFLRIFGVLVHNLTATGDSQGMGGTETSNNAASEVITEAGNSGQVKSKLDLCVLLAKKCMHRNQIVRRNGVTAFMISHGREARTVCDVLTRVPEAELSEDVRLRDKDYVLHVINMARETTRQLLQANTAHRDETSRRSAFHRDALTARQRATEFDLREGQHVSFENGTKNQINCTLKDITGFVGDIPVTAMIQKRNGDLQYVKYEDLRPAGTPRATLQMDRSTRIKIKDFLIFTSEIYGEKNYCGGVVTSLTDEESLFEVQVHAGSESCRSWMPSWIKEGKVTKSTKKCPTGYKPWTVLVTEDTVELVGALTESYLVTEDTLMQLRTKHFVV